MLENEKITIQKNGQEVECDVLFTFDCDANGKTYIGCTDHSKNEKREENIYVFSFDPVLGMGNLEKADSLEEREMIEDVLQQIRKQK